jgi:hypothetical protein
MAMYDYFLHLESDRKQQQQQQQQQQYIPKYITTITFFFPIIFCPNLTSL